MGRSTTLARWWGSATTTWWALSWGSWLLWWPEPCWPLSSWNTCGRRRKVGSSLLCGPWSDLFIQLLPAVGGNLGWNLSTRTSLLLRRTYRCPSPWVDDWNMLWNVFQPPWWRPVWPTALTALVQIMWRCRLLGTTGGVTVYSSTYHTHSNTL